MFKFANPDYLYLLILIPILIILFIGVRIFRKRDIAKFGSAEMMKQLMPEVSAGRQQAKFYLLLAAVALTILMLARPQYGSKFEKVKQRNTEIMIALDISNSMMATDIAPSRLEKSKQILSQLIDNLGDNRIGLVVFAGEAYIQLPITSDLASAKMFLASISPSLISQQGTAIGEAIDVSLRSFSSKKGVSRAIIVLTDGENHEDDAVKSAKKAAKQGIAVYVVGMGTTNGVPIPVENSTDFKRDRDGKIVITKLNEAMCREIAEAGQGIYVRADNSNAAQKAVSKEIEKLSSTEMETKVFTDFNDHFPLLAWVVLVLLLAEFFILEKRNKLFIKYKFF
ncbi:MAG: VWA domain-containing protein [Prevotellaceae bacterium]|jgi:Ca-activated chloride channel family protein|nr:VWA domain-containing protein [Prevotellaceae bacterium]